MASLKSGKLYNIVNAKSGTFIHIPNTENQTEQAVCWSDNGTGNQKWLLESQGTNWVLSNVATGHFLHYLPESNGLEDGLSVIGSAQRFEWEIVAEKEPGVYRIYVPDPDAPRGKNVDLADYGAATDGMHVILWSPWEGTNQTWKFIEV